MLKAVFYARFHSERGPIIVHHYPSNVVHTDKDAVLQDNSSVNDLISFHNVSSYIIPPYELCNRALSVSANDSCILGWPVSLEDTKYSRNRFTFNVCFVLSDKISVGQRTAWDVIVRKTARWFKSLEEDSGILSSSCEDHTTSTHTHDHEDDQVELVLQQIFEQLCQYEECCVRLSDEHVLNLRLDLRKPAAKRHVESWEVPLLIKEIGTDSALSTDLVFKQIRQHVDGINHVRRIGEVADVELALVQSCLSRLLARDIIRMMDVFHFQAVYAPTQDLAWFVNDDEMQDECCQYIFTSGTGNDQGRRREMIELYMQLRQGLTVADFCQQNATKLEGLDVRRFMTFGVFKGFLRRLQRYAIVTDQTQLTKKRAQTNTNRKTYEDAVKKFEEAWKTAALSSGWSTPPADLPASLRNAAVRSADEVKLEQDERLRSYLDGKHSFDQICVEMAMTEKMVILELDSGRFGDVCYFYR